MFWYAMKLTMDHALVQKESEAKLARLQDTGVVWRGDKMPMAEMEKKQESWVRHTNTDNIPDELKKKRGWVGALKSKRPLPVILPENQEPFEAWRTEYFSGTGEGKYSFLLNNSSYCFTFDELAEYARLNGIVYEYVGLIFHEDDDYVFIDGDGVLDSEHTYKPSVTDHLRVINEESWCEISLSGTGTHSVLHLPPELQRIGVDIVKQAFDVKVEIYHSKRFMLLTGNLMGQKLTVASDGKAISSYQELSIAAAASRSKDQHAKTVISQGIEVTPSNVNAPPLEWFAAALEVLPQEYVEDYKLWLDCIMSVHHTYGTSEAAIKVMDHFSSRGSNYKGIDEIIRKAQSCSQKKSGRSITWKSLKNFADMSIKSGVVNRDCSQQSVANFFGIYFVTDDIIKIPSVYTLTKTEASSFKNNLTNFASISSDEKNRVFLQARRFGITIGAYMGLRIIEYLNGKYFYNRAGAKTVVSRWSYSMGEASMSSELIPDVKKNEAPISAQCPLGDIIDYWIKSESRREIYGYEYIPWQPEIAQVQGQPILNRWKPSPFCLDGRRPQVSEDFSLARAREIAPTIYKYKQRLVGGSADLPGIHEGITFISEEEEANSMSWLYRFEAHTLQTANIIFNDGVLSVDKPPVIIYFSGSEGTGKTFFGQTYLRRFLGSQLVAYVYNPKVLEDVDNTSYCGYVIAFFDESVYAKSQKSMAKLKGMSTSDTDQRRALYVSPMKVMNPLIPIIATNADLSLDRGDNRRIFGLRPQLIPQALRYDFFLEVNGALDPEKNHTVKLVV